jgi:hypothetical protein
MTQNEKYLVLDSAFHGGGVISRHRKLNRARIAAERIQRQHREAGCLCGRGRVVAESDARAYSTDLHYSEPCR